MIFNQNDTIKLVCPVVYVDEPDGIGTHSEQKEIFIMRVRDEIIIIDDDVGTPLKVKKGIWFKRLERLKKHRTAFKEFLKVTRASKTEIIGIDLR